MSLPKHNHILKTPIKKTQNKKKNPKRSEIPRSNHEIPKSKIGERETKTEESKKQK